MVYRVVRRVSGFNTDLIGLKQLTRVSADKTSTFIVVQSFNVSKIRST